MEGIIVDSYIVKGKRTKRQRNHLSSPATSSVLSPTTSAEFSETATEEDEDMANCLMFLARGGHRPEPNASEEITTTAVKHTIRQFTEAATATSTGGKVESSVHECQTCNRCFSSHQALGGHRASHKRPKLSIPPASADGTKTALINEASIQLSMNSFSSPAATKLRIHQCAICGAGFNSGQALGGHMRRHRSPTLPVPAKKDEKSNKLSLDLNLPAPCDDDGDAVKPSSSSTPVTKSPSLSFASKSPILMLASSLVGCHY